MTKATIIIVETNNTTSSFNADSSNTFASDRIRSDGLNKAVITIVGTNTTIRHLVLIVVAYFYRTGSGPMQIVVPALDRIWSSANSSNTVPSTGIPVDGTDKVVIIIVKTNTITGLSDANSSNTFASTRIRVDANDKAVITIIGTII